MGKVRSTKDESREARFSTHVDRGASAHTVRAYRDTLKMFFQFLADLKKKGFAGLSLDDVHSDAVLAFLSHIESKRGNTPATRNCR